MVIYVKDGVFRDSRKFLKTQDGRTIFGAQPEDWLAEGWEEYILPEPEESTPEEIKQQILENLEEYYNSEVRGFETSRGVVVLNGSERLELRNQLERAKSRGKEEYLYEGERYSIGFFLDFLDNLEDIEFDNDQVLETHKINIENLGTIEDLENYDYTRDFTARLALVSDI